jgi:hypothetical protein
MANQNNQSKLRQLQNAVEVIGTLKSKELEEKYSKKGNLMITGKLVVVSKVGDKINEISIKVLVMATSKLYKGIKTVMNEYKASDDVGMDLADRVRITGELNLNEYYNQAGKLVQFNEIKGVFYNRLEKDDKQPDKALASVETVIESYSEKLDSEGLPSGDLNVHGFTVAFGDNVVELKNAVVNSELAEAFQNLYQPGQTGRLTFRINNYVEVEEKEEEAAPQEPTHGFGSTETVESNVIKNYVNNLEIIGGDIPYFGGKEYTPENIQEAKKIRNLKLQSLQPQVPDTPPTGFGTGFGTTPKVNNDDMPDF